MSQTKLIELARTGDPQAIATLLTQSLQNYGVTVAVDWHGGQLNLRLFADRLPEREFLLDRVQHTVHPWKIRVTETARLFAYETNQPTPNWHQVISLNDQASGSTRPAPPTVLAPISTTVASTPNISASELSASELSTSESFTSETSIPTSSFPASSPSYTFIPPADTVDRFLVCGLGSLGQYSVLNLKRFSMGKSEIYVTAIDNVQPDEWEVHNLPDLLTEAPIIGDCRNDETLLRAGIEQCRAILIVTSNENVNVETAIAVRRLNPNIRIVMRSSRQNLNQLLKEQLGDFVALEPIELPAPAFALAGLQEEILGFFNIGDYRFQVVEQAIQPKDFRFDGFPVSALHKPTYRLLSYSAARDPHPPHRAFYQWKPDTRVKAGDTIAYIEVVGRELGQNSPELSNHEKPGSRLWQGIKTILQRGWRENLSRLGEWMQAQRTRQVVAIGLSFALCLWLAGAVLLKSTLNLTWQTALSAAFILLIGGYGDLFEGLQPSVVPGWVQVLSALITLTSLASVLGVLGLIADNLLSSRFDFLQKRPVIPTANHVVIVGLGRIGHRIATILQEFKQTVVIMTEQPESSNLQAPYPIIVGDLITELPKVNLATAKSVVVVTDDQMLNLEVALMAQHAARQVNRSIGVVIRTYDQRFRDNLSNLLPDAKALAAYELSAEAFAGAAFGENILGLFRLNDQTILVTEYQITADDTLVHKPLFQIAYGYGVVPIFHQRANQMIDEDFSKFILPSDDRILQVGDRLVVLASINGLRRIEYGELVPPRCWRLEVKNPVNSLFLYECGNDLARISGCDLNQARAFMNTLPNTINLYLYDYQAYRLEQELRRQLSITLVPLS